jgi:putative heme-binding domain-containing protein
VPASSKLLYVTKLIAPGQKGRLTFDAPKELGEYPFVCTFPGHWRRMSGILAVVKDVDEYVASHAQAATPRITEWKLGDFMSELSTDSPTHDPQDGKEFFSKLACVQCHKLGPQGYAYGPDLTDVFVRYTNDRPAILQQVLEPSKIIADRYRNFRFELKNGEPVLGMVLKEDSENVTVQSGPADSLIQNLKVSEIVQRIPQESSPMPLGLLNSLSKEQVLSLLSYLETGGKDTRHEHRH